MTHRRWALAMVHSLIAIPVIVAFTAAASFHEATRSNHSLVSSGIERDYQLYVPPSYNGRTPTPLVISFHGAGLWGVGQEEISGWDRVADREGFIVVYPSAARGAGPRIWHVEQKPRLLERDVRFVADMLDTLEERFNIDERRVYANGLSNGGGMSFALSCVLRGRIAAVGLVAAALTLPFEWCPDTTPVPVIAFHGTADPQIPYRGGATWVSPRRFPSVSRFLMQWSRRNRCAPTSVETRIATDVTRREYEGCVAPVAFYTIEGGGHTWPGGSSLPESWLGRTTTSIDASAVMWDFFRKHELDAGTIRRR